MRSVLLSLLVVASACGDDDTVGGVDMGDGRSDMGVADQGVDSTVVRVENGEACSSGLECVSGFCVDGVCCASECEGTCQRCDESGDGTCAPVERDLDPDDECGVVACDAYYVAIDDTCFYRTDADVGCDGAGACQDAGDRCPEQPPGDEQMRCAPACGGLSSGTCSLTTVGECVYASSVVDDFDGPSLDAAWTLSHVGGAPSFTVDGTLELTDSPPADTPSSSCSWIYDLSMDRGNQMAQPVPIGTGDFVLEFDLSATSDLPQLTLGGVALTNGDDIIEYYATMWDGSEVGFGVIQGGVNGLPGWSTPAAETASVSVRVERVGSTITTEVDGTVVNTVNRTADIQNLAIVHTKHVCDGTTYEFGTVTIDRLSLCF